MCSARRGLLTIMLVVLPLGLGSEASALLDTVPLPPQSQAAVRFSVVEVDHGVLAIELSVDEKLLGTTVGQVTVGAVGKNAEGRVRTVVEFDGQLLRYQEKQVLVRFKMLPVHALNSWIGLYVASPLGFGGLRYTFAVADFVEFGVARPEVSRKEFNQFTNGGIGDMPPPRDKRVRPIRLDGKGMQP